eukprot:356694-Chlamydomonas_euryale.AAC.8
MEGPSAQRRRRLCVLTAAARGRLRHGGMSTLAAADMQLHRACRPPLPLPILALLHFLKPRFAP